MPQQQDDLGISCLPRRSTLLLLYHNGQSRLRQPIAQTVPLLILGDCILTAVFQSNLPLLHNSYYRSMCIYILLLSNETKKYTKFDFMYNDKTSNIK